MLRVASIVLLVALPAAWALTRPAPEFGEAAQPEAVSEESRPLVAPAPAGRPRPPGPAPPVRAAPGTYSATLPTAPPVRPPQPAVLRIGTLGVEAPVVAVGTNAVTNELAVPPRADTVAWYRRGPSPGQPGSAVLAGHVDWAGREGVFFRLTRLQPGDTIDVVADDGRVDRFEVRARRSYAKAALPIETLFASGGPAVLALVTCGGDFDEAARRYEENTVVYAVPIFT